MKLLNKKHLKLIIMLLAIGLFIYLMASIPVDDLKKSFNKLGFSITLVFVVTFPMFIFSTLSVYVLLEKNDVSFKYLFNNYVIGDAYNKLLPFAGIGGEPYRIQNLSHKIGKIRASKLICRNRLVLMCNNIFFAALTLLITLLIVKIPSSYTTILIFIELALVVLLVFFIGALLSALPERIITKFVKRFNVEEDFTEGRLSRSQLFTSMFYKTLTGLMSLVEIYTILYLISYEAGIREIIAISAMLSLSSVIFFFIPQGVGVNEAGISGAFILLGLTSSVGILLAIIRRTRIVFWALLTLLWHFFIVLYKKFLVRKNLKDCL